ncbi:MAG: hypothetical protein KAT15_11365 [Bacteroidales bacterium]|nr:hypothetical protein [Bacteroidales bacterium]
MHRLIATIGFLLFVLSGIRAQEQPDFNRINNGTYRLYLEQKWDSVIVMGNEALKQEMDYYYLRMRMGIAYYHRKNYRIAAAHFTAALDMNQDDPVALEYLYYSRLLSGKRDQANLVRDQFKGDLALRLPPLKGKFVDKIGVVYLYNLGLNDDLLSDPENVFTGLPPGFQYVSRRFSNVSLTLQNSISPGFSLVHGYTYLTKTDHYYYNDETFNFYGSDLNVYLHQYYLSPRITTISGFTIMPVFHLINGHYQLPVEISTGGPSGFPRIGYYYDEFNDFVGGIGLVKGWGCIDLSLGAYYATLNLSEQVQNRIGLTWYPTGNLNFYAGAYMNSQYEMTEGYGEFRIIPELQLGFSISEKVWFDLNATAGEISNYLENNGSIVYNSFSETIDKKAKLSISIPVSDKGSLLFLGGRWTSNRSEFYALDATQTGILNTLKFHTLSFYGGLSWKF